MQMGFMNGAPFLDRHLICSDALAPDAATRVDMRGHGSGAEMLEELAANEFRVSRRNGLGELVASHPIDPHDLAPFRDAMIDVAAVAEHRDELFGMRALRQ